MRIHAVAFGLVSGFVVLSGCQSESSSFTWPWEDEPLAPLDAREIEVSRFEVADPSEPGEGRETIQHLEVNLETGEVHFEDTDGTVHEFRFLTDPLERIRDALADRSWLVARAKYPPDLQAVRMYELSVRDSGGRAGRPVRWVPPGYREEDLPPVFSRIESLFDQAHRRVHPMSEAVNLVPDE